MMNSTADRPPLQLALPASDHQAGSDDDQNDADCRMDPVLVVRRDAYMRIADVNAMMFGVRNRNEEGKDSQQEHYDSNQHQSFHQVLRDWKDIYHGPSTIQRAAVLGC
jgi:hypothetical protein